MKKIREIIKNNNIIFAIAFSIFFAGLSVIYSTTLYSWVDGDEIVVIEAEKAKIDANYPDRSLVQTMGYGTYAYPKIVAYLEKSFDIPDYKKILLFVIVFNSILAAFIALKWLGFSTFVSMGTSVVALMPRFAPVGESFGTLTPYEVTGRFLIIPAFWILAAWFIKRQALGKKVFPVFFVLGLCSYIHPATAIMFFVLITLVHFFLIISEKNYIYAFKNLIINAASFSVGAFFLLQEIFGRVTAMAVPAIQKVVSSADFVNALMYRIPWEYPPASVVWLRHVLIVSFIFIILAFYSLYLIRKGHIKKESIEYNMIVWSAWTMIISFVVHIAVPNIQLFLMQRFDAPLIFWQFGRIFKFYYLALFLIFAVVLSYVYKKYGKKVAIPLIVVGILSSSFFFEWFQFVIGFKNYQREYIPANFQKNKPEDQYLMYANICKSFDGLGAKPTDVVLSDDFNLRYFCNLRPHVTFEEGTAHIFLGRESLVAWKNDVLKQTELLRGYDKEALMSYAKQNNAKFVVLPANSPAQISLSRDKKEMIFINGTAIIRL